MEHLRCVVERITYQNEQNGYTVIKCRARDYSELVTVVGIMAEVHVGSVLSVNGTWKIDGKYGRQRRPGRRHCLHAIRLAFTHPVTGEPLFFETPIPDYFMRQLT